MGKSYTGNIPYAATCQMGITQPLDDRIVVDELSNLNDGSIEFPYVGMIVNVKGTPSLYLLVSTKQENGNLKPDVWKEFRSVDSYVIDTEENLNDVVSPYEGMCVYVKSKPHSMWVYSHLDTDEKKDNPDIDYKWREFKDFKTTDVQNQIDTISNTISNNKTELNNKIVGVQTKIGELETKHDNNIQGVQSQFTAITDEIKKDVNSLKETKATKIEVETIRNNLINLEDTVSTNKTDLEGKINDNQTKINTLESKHTTDIQGVQGQISNLNTTIENLNINELQTQIESLKETLKTIDINGIQTQILDINNRINSLEIPKITYNEDSQIIKIESVTP